MAIHTAFVFQKSRPHSVRKPRNVIMCHFLELNKFHTDVLLLRIITLSAPSIRKSHELIDCDWLG